MSFQEKEAGVSLFGTVFISWFYFADVLQRFQTSMSDTVETVNVFKFWAAALLVYIPVIIVFKIIIHIIFSIINTVATHEKEPSFTDELDRLIILKATRNFYHLFMAGFLLSIGTLVINLPPTAMFLGFMFSMIAAGIMLDISQLYFYRRGV